MTIKKTKLPARPRARAGSTSEAPVLPPFGASFFVNQLRRFVRDRCPEPSEHLPIVELHLADGEVLDVCHVIGLSPWWVALAARERSEPGAAMRTEVVPYDVILRITIRPSRANGKQFGFDPHHAPEIVTQSSPTAAEGALRAASCETGEEKRLTSERESRPRRRRQRSPRGRDTRGTA